MSVHKEGPVDDIDNLDEALVATAFEITVASSTVQLTDRKGDASYSTRNLTGRPVHAKAQVVVTSPTVASWFAVEQPERDFSPGVVQQIPVHIQVPTDVAGGTYGFRLDVRGTANPDEEYAAGPAVSFTVPDKPPLPPPWWKTLPWLWIGLGVAAAVLIIAGVVAFLLLRNVTVPNVVGQTLPNAQATLQAASLSIGTPTEKVTGAQEQTVIEQIPAAATPAPRNSAVDLVLEAARVSVPRVLGSTRTDGTTTLTNAGLVVGTVTEDVTNAAPGTIIRQNPAENTRVTRGSTVNLVLEAAFIAVPPVTQIALGEAQNRIVQAGLRVGAVNRIQVPGGRFPFPDFVVDQAPGVGTMVRRGSMVSVTVANCVQVNIFFPCP